MRTTTTQVAKMLGVLYLPIRGDGTRASSVTWLERDERPLHSAVAQTRLSSAQHLPALHAPPSPAPAPPLPTMSSDVLIDLPLDILCEVLTWSSYIIIASDIFQRSNMALHRYSSSYLPSTCYS